MEYDLLAERFQRVVYRLLGEIVALSRLSVEFYHIRLSLHLLPPG